MNLVSINFSPDVLKTNSTEKLFDNKIIKC